MDLNYFYIIGKCFEVNSTYLSLLNEDNQIIKVFFDDNQDISDIKVDILTKVEGRITVLETGIIVLIAEKIYQIKQNYNCGGDLVV